MKKFLLISSIFLTSISFGQVNSNSHIIHAPNINRSDTGKKWDGLDSLTLNETLSPNAFVSADIFDSASTTIDSVKVLIDSVSAIKFINTFNSQAAGSLQTGFTLKISAVAQTTGYISINGLMNKYFVDKYITKPYIRIYVKTRVLNKMRLYGTEWHIYNFQ